MGKLIKKDKMIGQSITKFTTKGCMAQVVEFEWTGTIVGSHHIDDNKDLLFYKVDIGEQEHKIIPSWYIIKSENEEYEIYD